MKGDFTRDTFRKKKHYRRVPKQQGRVDVDADWNEQVSIEVYHERTSLRDVIGQSGAPQENPGFGIIIPRTPDSGSYKIGKGRYYVDGILCENEEEVDALDQPDLPPLEALKYPFEPQLTAFPTEPGGIYLAYLHVWERHLTALDDPDIRESALGGPDTATRTKVVWQVQLLKIGGRVSKSITAEADVKVYQLGPPILIPDGEGDDPDPMGPYKIRFRVNVGAKSGVIEVVDRNANKNPNEVDNISVYVNIEGQTGIDMKAEEIGPDKGVFHVKWSINQQEDNIQIGDPLGNRIVSGLEDDLVIVATYTYESGTDPGNLSCMSQFGEWDKLVAMSSGLLQARSEPETSDTACMIPPQAKYTGLENQLYRVEIHDPGHIRSTGETSAAPPTFNWSRDNGIVVTKITKIASGAMTVTDTGKDRHLHFSPQQWVEVTDDRYELWGIPGSMVRLVDVQGNDLIFDPAKVKGEPITIDKFPEKFNPKVRRWDNNGEEGPIEVRIPPENEGYINLESGVQVKFSKGTYRTGDYWLIPARTLKRDIEWPQTETGPEALAPDGIKHHFARLAILRYTGNSVLLISDCRKFFPPASAASITTGKITIGIDDLNNLGHNEEFNFGPFKHGIENAKTPPAIMLGRIPDNTLNGIPVEDRNTGRDTITNYVSFMEDRRLYEFNNDPYDNSDNAPPPLFKAVGINLKTFRVNIKHEQHPVTPLVLRFWAISAGMQVDPQVSIDHPSPPG